MASYGSKCPGPGPSGNKFWDQEFLFWDGGMRPFLIWDYGMRTPPFPPSSLIFSCTVEFQCVQSKRDSDILIIGVFNNGTFSMDDYCFIMQVSQSLYGSLSVYIFFTFIIQAHAA